jgi:uncharacterized protein YgiM (DUF1202 family)
MNKTNDKFITLVAAGVLLLGAWVVGSSDAHAETVRATKNVRVMAKPGERSRVVTRVPRGKSLKVIAKRGRWIKVRANGRTGWVTRTTVRNTRQARTPVRKVRRRPFVEGRSKRRRGWSGKAPRDRVGADAVDEEELDDDDFAEEEAPRRRVRRSKRRKVSRPARRALDDEADEDDEVEEKKAPKAKVVVVSASMARVRSRPSSRSRSKMRVRQGDELTFVRKNRSGKWMLVENSDGEAGWIRSKDVQPDGFVYPKALKRGGARIGYASLTSVFASDGNGELANYNIAAAAATLSVGGDYVYKYSPKYFIRGDATYTGIRSNPGIRFQNMAGQAADIAFVKHEVQLGAAVGYNFKSKSGMAAYARVGYHYGKLDIADVEDFEKNLAYLPSEILSGITVGARIDIPRFNKKIGIRAGADMMYQGTRQQTKGLEDGDVSKVSAAWATGHVIYQWKPNMTLEGVYRYSYSKTEWTGQAEGSMRPHAATEAARKDVGHTVMVGVGKTF